MRNGLNWLKGFVWLSFCVLLLVGGARNAAAAEWVSAGWWPHGNYYIYALTTGTDGKIWTAGLYGYTAYRNISNNGLSLVPSPNGATGQLVINPRVSGDAGVLVQMQISADGNTFSNVGIPGPETVTITPTTTTIYVRLEREASPS